MARHIIYTYRCTRGECRYIEKLADVPRQAQIRCSQCGAISNLINTEK